MSAELALSRVDRRHDDAVSVPMVIPLEEGDVLGRNSAAPDNRVSRRAILCGPTCSGGIQVKNVSSGLVFHNSGRTDASTGDIAFDAIPSGASVTLRRGDIIRFLPDQFIYEVVPRVKLHAGSDPLSPPATPRPRKVRRQISGDADVNRSTSRQPHAAPLRESIAADLQHAASANKHGGSGSNAGTKSSLSSLSTTQRSAVSKPSVLDTSSTASISSSGATPVLQKTVGTSADRASAAAADVVDSHRDGGTELRTSVSSARGCTASSRVRDCDVYLFPRSPGLSHTVLRSWQHGLRKLGARSFTEPAASAVGATGAARAAAGAGSDTRLHFAPGDSDSDADGKPLSQPERPATSPPATSPPATDLLSGCRTRIIVASDDVSVEQLRAWWRSDLPLATNVHHLSLDAELQRHLQTSPALRQQALDQRGFAEFHTPEWVIRCIGRRKRLPPEAFPWLGRSTHRPVPAAGHLGGVAGHGSSDGASVGHAADDSYMRGVDQTVEAETSADRAEGARTHAAADPFAAALRARDVCVDMLGQPPAGSLRSQDKRPIASKFPPSPSAESGVAAPSRLPSLEGTGSRQSRAVPGFSEHGEDAEELSQRFPSPQGAPGAAAEAASGMDVADTSGIESWWRALYRCGDDASRWGIDPETTPPLACPFSEEDIERANGALLRSHPWLVPDITAGRKYFQQSAGASATAAGIDDGTAGASGSGATGTCELPHNPHGRARGINLNEHITRHLLPLLDVYTVVRDADSEARIKQLDHAIGALTHCPFAVRTAADADRVSGIGRKTRGKIAEILATGRLQRAEALARSPRIRALLELNDVLWVGPVTANALWSAGYRSLRDLRERGQHVLSHQQRLGLQYYDELRQRVSRAESEHMARIVAAEVQRILPGSLCILGGSFRRGQPTQSDFDFVLSPPPPFTTWDLLPALYRRLRALGIIVHDLSGSWLQQAADGSLTDVPGVGWEPAHMPDAAYAHYERAGFSLLGTTSGGSARCATAEGGKRGSAAPLVARGPFPGAPGVAFGSGAMEGGCHTYFGISITPSWPHAVHRRIDLKCFHHTELPPALIQWTGNTPLNRSIRLYAANLGFELDELSLMPLALKKIMGSGNPGAPGRIPVRSEFDVFTFLGLTFIRPDERNCFSHHQGAGGAPIHEENLAGSKATGSKEASLPSAGVMAAAEFAAEFNHPASGSPASSVGKPASAVPFHGERTASAQRALTP